MSQQKLVAYHIARLRDKDPAVRIRAIRELAELGDPSALEPLQHTFRADPDLEVRKASQEAGRAIFLKSQHPKQ